MCFATFLTRPTVWIALAAILWASLAPSLAHALSLSPDGHHIHRIQVDVCAGGADDSATMTLDVVHDGPRDASQDGHAGDGHGDNHHCPLCRNPHADVGILPTPVPVLPVPVGRATTYPPLFFLAANPLHAWSAVQPRAPPAN